MTEKIICSICGNEIPDKTGGWLDDELVCNECFEHETGEENES